MSRSAAIEAEGLGKTYFAGFRRKEVRALKDLSLTVHEGEIFGFIGPNGAGKTTTIKILTGLMFPSTGSARLLGRPLQDVNVRRRIGFMPEQPYFYRYLTAEQFLDFYGQLSGMSRALRRERIEQLLARLDLQDARHVPLVKFSKGMIQRIGIAQAIIHDPNLLILDEPMSGLDPVGRRRIREIIVDLNRVGKTIFFSSHILSDVALLCHRVGILVDGTLRRVGEVDALLRRRADLYEAVVEGAGDLALRRLTEVAEVVEVHQSKRVFRVVGERAKRDLLRIVVEEGGDLLSLTPRGEALEEILIEEIGRRRADG